MSDPLAQGVLSPSDARVRHFHSHSTSPFGGQTKRKAQYEQPAAQNKVSRRNQMQVFDISYAAYVIIYFGRKPFSAVKQVMGTDLQLSTQELGSIDTAFLVMYAIGQFTLTPLGDKLGPRKMLSASILIAGLATSAFAFTSSTWVLMLNYGISGFVQSVGFPLCMKALAPWFSAASRGTVLGVWTTSQQVGGVLSTSFAGYVAVHYGWRSAFSYSGLFLAMAALLIWVGLVDAPSSSEAAPKSPNKTKKDSGAPGPTSFTDVLRLPGILSLGMSYFCIKLVRYTLMFWLPFYLSKVQGFGVAEAAYFSTLFDVGGVFGSLLNGYITDNIFPGQRLGVATGACVLSGLVLFSFASVDTANPVIIGALLFGIGALIAGPDSVLGGASTQDICERQHASHMLTTACGITNGLGSIGSMMQGPLSAFLIDNFGWGGLFQMLGVLCGVGAAIVMPVASIERATTRAARTDSPTTPPRSMRNVHS